MSDLTEPFLGRNPESVSITNSEIQTFKDCRRKWWLGTYRGLKPKEKKYTGPLMLGTRIHNALEHFYVTGEDPISQYERLQRIDNNEFLSTNPPPEKVVEFNADSDLGRIMLEGYMEWLAETNADSNIDIVGAEKKVALRLDDDPRVELMGKIDVVFQRKSDGSTGAMDHKSAKTFNDYYKYGGMTEQLMFYTMLLRANQEGERFDGGMYNLLKKVKRSAKATPPFYDRIDLRYNDQTLESFWYRTMGVVRDIMATRDALDAGADHRLVAYPRPSNDCGWKCPFFQVCTMFDDGSHAEGMIEAFYEQSDPNARYIEQESE